VRPRTSLRATLAVGVAAAAVPVLVGLPFLGRYGWDRDELYFLAASHHLALGYVDFPPLVALLGRVVVWAFGPSLDALRLSTAVIGSSSAIFVALCARELGGGLRAQAGAAAAWVTAPLLLGAASIFHPTWLDLAAQTATLYLVLVAAVRPAPRVWIAVGLVAGLGLEAKYTIAVMLAALVVGFAATRRREVFRHQGPWLAAGLALLLLSPNLAWQVAHGWPSAQFSSSQRAKTADDTPPLTYLAQAFAFLAAAAVVAAIGTVWMWRRAVLRPFAIASVVVFVGFALEQGRAYYPLPAMALAVAAGAVALERWRPARRRARPAVLGVLVLLQLALLAAAAPIVLPVRTTAGMIQSGVWEDSFYKDEIGWPELTAQTARAWRSLTPAERRGAAILAQNYGEAGALAHFGPALGLPPPLSGHLSWQYWRPDALPQRTLVTVGIDPFTLRGLCTTFHRVATIENRWRLGNEERGRTIDVCRLARPLGAMWDDRIATDDL
jgi:4-amino-4-deoxy-L-arabinose transferase-like glycosyltransferase